jgi:phosphoenolpyruvate carboxykinase (ATP)
VKDAITEHTVDWNNFNIPFEAAKFKALKEALIQYLNSKGKLWVRDAYACAHNDYRIGVRVINENSWSNLFAYNMFIRPTEQELTNFEPEWLVIQAPGFLANPEKHGTRQGNFAIISFTDKTIIIGGTAYTGEMKKGVFTVLNFLMPQQHNVLSMHCSANIGANNDVALFFGLSGTGKTTLSADSNRKLIGDDEHGWNDTGVFNFEGGCYAKC